jgi:hypothetical protein
MITLTFNGTSEEVLNDIKAFVGQKNAVEVVIEKAEPEQIVKKTTKKKTAKKVEEPAKVAEPVKAEEPTELTDEQKVELRNKTVAFCQKNAANKVKIKEFMKEVGVEQLTHIKPSDLPKFNAMVGE